jgi:anhydro-N-acetylmuramic acid kinase
MSGTSLDGIDAAIVETDGRTITRLGAWLTTPYDKALRERLRGCLGATGPVDDVARDLTIAHAEAVRALLIGGGHAAGDIRVLGFHGHTIDHRPADGVTRQIGDGALLAAETGIDVVADFRAADVAAGGEGAPFAPLYHAALCRDLAKPVCVLNVGGVANLTWIGADGVPLAFDTGPGNALLDDWVRRHTGAAMDTDGALAASGTAVPAAVAAYLDDPYFARPAPKSLDRLDFDLAPVAGLSPADGAATLVAVTCAAVARAIDHLPAPPERWLVTGGGRHNPVIMAILAAMMAAPVEPVERVGWNGDALEAQAFAFLATRSLAGLPLSLPTTTGVAAPITGGRLFAVV